MAFNSKSKIMACFFSFFLILIAPTSWSQKTAALGTVKALSQTDVKYIPASTKTPKTIRVGDSFYNHDQFITGPEGRVLLEFRESNVLGQGNRVVLGANSDLVINAPESGPGTTLNLNKGSVFSNVKKRYSRRGDDEFRVVTDNGVAGVRGTKFFVSFINFRLAVAVIESHEGAGVEVRKELYNFDDSKIISDKQALLVNRGDQIKDVSPRKMSELPKEFFSELKQTSSFEGSSLPKSENPVVPNVRTAPLNPHHRQAQKIDSLIRQYKEAAVTPRFGPAGEMDGAFQRAGLVVMEGVKQLDLVETLKTDLQKTDEKQRPNFQMERVELSPKQSIDLDMMTRIKAVESGGQEFQRETLQDKQDSRAIVRGIRR